MNIMQWTDRIRQVKIFLILAAILIAVASLLVSHFLTQDLKEQERHRMAVWAEAMRTLNNADTNTDLNLVLKVLNDNNSIPVIVLDAQGNVTEFRNIALKTGAHQDSIAEIEAMGKRLLAEHKNIRIGLGEHTHDYIDVCYDESVMLKRLAVYPFIQLGIVLIFVVIAIFALLTSKRAEQNKVWVGLSKETYPSDGLIPELDKDVRRLQLIADRFSKIGSNPRLVPTSLNDVLDHVIEYMDHRTSKNISLVKDLPAHDVIVNLNPSLFEWVIENLSKNAVDAMGADGGIITLRVGETNSRAMIEVSDTGKGIRKKDIGNVFRPGFTTKERGWGLGLSLARRIVEDYHRGKIYVRNSEIGRGTTFCIELRKS